MNGVYEHLIVGFGTLKFFAWTKDTSKDLVFEAVHAEVDGPGELQEYGALNMKEKIDPDETEKLSYWHDKIVLLKCDISNGSKQLFRYAFFSIWVFFHNHSRITRRRGRGRALL